MPWTTLNLKVTTPLFSSGADQKATGDTGIRVASLRGVMRFWFRALAGSRTGTSPDGLNLLAAMERRIFGGPGIPSACVMRIPADGRNLKVISVDQRHSFIRHQGSLEERRKDPTRWIVYLLGQGLGDLANMTVVRPYVNPGSTFQLMIRFTHQRTDPPELRAAVTALAYASLWLTCALGGLGSRTRRGFGGIRITGLGDQAHDLPWPAETLLTPGLEFYKSLPDLDAAHVLTPLTGWVAHLDVLRDQVIAESKQLRHQELAESKTPAFPVLSAPHTAMAMSEGADFPDWNRALIEAGKRLRIARARIKFPDRQVRYDPPRKTWEWLNVVHGNETDFDIGALGLPLVFNQDISVNAFDGTQELRRASMVWLRPVGDPDGKKYRLLSMAFLTEYLPDDAEIRLRHTGKPNRQLDLTTLTAIARARQWMSRPINYK